MDEIEKMKLEKAKKIKDMKIYFKEIGFSHKGEFYYKVKGDKVISIHFQRRMDGFYNINLGIQYETNMDLVNLRNRDIGWVFISLTGNYLQDIQDWFDQRDSLDQIKYLFGKDY